jgi:beta-fructofuranosidase
VFVPDQAYDNEGVFTGCFFPTGPLGEPDQLSIFYSSVNHLPISWDQPYTRGCEGLAMATSKDGGKTCELDVPKYSTVFNLISQGRGEI